MLYAANSPRVPSRTEAMGARRQTAAPPETSADLNTAHCPAWRARCPGPERLVFVLICMAPALVNAAPPPGVAAAEVDARGGLARREHTRAEVPPPPVEPLIIDGRGAAPANVTVLELPDGVLIETVEQKGTLKAFPAMDEKNASGPKGAGAADTSPTGKKYLDLEHFTAESDTIHVRFHPEAFKVGGRLFIGQSANGSSLAVRSVPRRMRGGTLLRGPPATPPDTSITVLARKPLQVFAFEAKQGGCGYPQALGRGWAETEAPGLDQDAGRRLPARAWSVSLREHDMASWTVTGSDCVQGLVVAEPRGSREDM